jgi:hypothetical protein
VTRHGRVHSDQLASARVRGRRPRSEHPSLRSAPSRADRDDYHEPRGAVDGSRYLRREDWSFATRVVRPSNTRRWREQSPPEHFGGAWGGIARAGPGSGHARRRRRRGWLFTFRTKVPAEPSQVPTLHRDRAVFASERFPHCGADQCAMWRTGSCSIRPECVGRPTRRSTGSASRSP